jgi:hypothetical protein
MKTSDIARTLDKSRYKTEQLINNIENKITKRILSDLKRGGDNETHRR